MLFSIVALVAFVQLALAAPPAQSTYCYEDNLLRAFQHTPAPASTYCRRQTGYPTFLKATTYPTSRLGSACSCFSRYPLEPTSTATGPACNPTEYEFMSTGQNSGHKVDIALTIDRTVTCGGTGYRVTNACGSFKSFDISFDNTRTLNNPDYCFFPNTAPSVDSSGVDFIAHTVFTLYRDSMGRTAIKGQSEPSDYYPGAFVAIACDTEFCVIT